MSPTAHLSHTAPGRTRIRIPTKKHNRGYFRRVALELRQLEGVRRIEVNPTTASILLFHDTELGAIREFAGSHELFDLTSDSLARTPLTETLSRKLEEFDRRLDVSTNGALDLSTLGFLGTMSLGVVQIFRGEVLSPASSLFADALRALPALEGRRIVHGPARIQGNGRG